MRRYLLDTPILGAYLNGRAAALRLVEPWLARGEAATSILAYGGVLEYLRSRDDFGDVYLQLRELLHEIFPIPVGFPVVERYGDLRRRLRPPYGPGLIGDVDTLVAATAIENDLTLVTTDSDFERVPGLKLMRIDRAALRQRCRDGARFRRRLTSYWSASCDLLASPGASPARRGAAM